MNITPIFTKSKRTSNSLLRDIRRRSSLNRNYEKRTLELLKKSIEERSRTYSALSKRDKEGGGIFGSLFGGSLLLKRLRGRGRGGSGGMGFSGVRPRKPLLPRGGGGIGRNLGRLGKFGKFGRVGPLAILGTGLDFSGRLGSGQNIAQATIGAGGGLAGALVGGAKGAAIGTAFGGPLGTLIGGIIGSGVGAFAGGSIADLLTGVNADRQRKSQIFIDKKRREKTLFSGALDQFDDTLKTFEEDTAPTLIAFKKQVDEDDQTGKIPILIPPKPSTPFLQRPAVRAIGLTLLAAGATVAAIKAAPVLIPLIAKAKILLPAFKKAAATKGFFTLPLEKQLRLIARNIPKKINKTGRKVNPVDGRFFAKRRVNKDKILERNIQTDIFQAVKKAKKFFQDTGFTDPNIIRKNIVERTTQDLDDLVRLFERGKISKNTFRMTRKAIESSEIETLKRIDQYDSAIIDFFTNPKNFDKAGNIIMKNYNNMIKKLDLFSGKVPTDTGAIIEQLEKSAGALKGKDFDILDDLIKNLQKGINPKRLPFESINKVSNDLETPDSTNLAFDPFANEVKPDLGAKIGDELALAPKEDTFPNSTLESITKSQQSDTIINDSDNIAMASNNIFVMNNPTTIRPMSLGGSGQRTVVIKNESFDAVAKYAQMTGLLTV